jgi:hypothetical protein
MAAVGKVSYNVNKVTKALYKLKKVADMVVLKKSQANLMKLPL